MLLSKWNEKQQKKIFVAHSTDDSAVRVSDLSACFDNFESCPKIPAWFFFCSEN